MPEYLYHVDAKDNILGRVERSEAHAKGVMHRSGAVLVLNSKGDVCLANRSLRKGIFPGCTDSVCSFHVQYGQSYEDAAKAELSEETGIDAKPIYLGKFVLDKEPDRMVVAVFLVVFEGDTRDIVLDPEEAESCAFYAEDEVEKIIKGGNVTSWLPGAWKIFKNSK